MGSGYLCFKSVQVAFVDSLFSSLSMRPTVMLGYDPACHGFQRDFDVGAKRRRECWLMFFNGNSVLLIAAIVLLVVVKPL